MAGLETRRIDEDELGLPSVSTPVTRWRVVWALRETMLIFWPIRRLSRVDLPTLGRPTMATKPVRACRRGWIRSLLWQEFQRPLGGLLFGSAATHADAAGLEAEAGDLALDLEFL
jgi:hypothetical protein